MIAWKDHDERVARMRTITNLVHASEPYTEFDYRGLTFRKIQIPNERRMHCLVEVEMPDGTGIAIDGEEAFDLETWRTDMLVRILDDYRVAWLLNRHGLV
jgi:hypothetical protein